VNRADIWPGGVTAGLCARPISGTIQQGDGGGICRL